MSTPTDFAAALALVIAAFICGLASLLLVAIAVVSGSYSILSPIPLLLIVSGYFMYRANKY